MPRYNEPPTATEQQDMSPAVDTSFFHIGVECDGRFVKGPFASREEAEASCAEYGATDDGYTWHSEIGGHHVVQEGNSSIKTAHLLERLLDAYDARECGLLTAAQGRLLEKHNV